MSQDLTKIKNLINQSTLLTPAEKTEWLNLLGNMNDKQKMELEEILNPAYVPPKVVEQPKPAPVAKSEPAKVETHKPTPPPVKLETPPHKPVLSHITNLPQNLSRQAEQANLKDKIKDQKSNEFKKHLSEVLNEKELVSGKTDNHASQKPAEPVKHAEIHKEEVKKPIETVKPEIKPKEKPEEVNKPVSADNIELPTSLADVAVLKPNVIRAYKLPQLLECLKAMVSKEGYFEIQVHLEQSPLYKLYLYTGSRMLEQNMDFSKLAEQLQIEHRDYFTRSEFEYVSDLLKGIQVNS